MLWATVCVCFFGFLRSGDVTVPSDSEFDPAVHITFSNVSLDDVANPQLIKLRLEASKTDPFRKGVDIVLGRTNNQLCPIADLLAYLAVKSGKPGFLFAFNDGRLLTKVRFVNKVRQALSLAGLDAKCYAGHSFRIGAATTSGMCRLSDFTIKMLGRWESTAYLLYIRTPRVQLAKLLAIIGTSLANPTTWLLLGYSVHPSIAISCSPHVCPSSIYCYSIVIIYYIVIITVLYEF